MRLRAILFAVVVLAGVAALSWRLAERATAWFEEATTSEVRTALAAAGQDWATVSADGLRVELAGAAPDEGSRFRAHEIVRQIVTDRRLADATTLAASAPLEPPDFALELLRNEGDVSLIGLVPETGGRDVIRAALGAGGLEDNVTDMLESASDPAPDGWREALGFGLSVLSQLPRAKISVIPGAVSVIAVADSDGARGAVEDRLRHATPPGVELSLDISAPRPVIAPFVFDVSLRDGPSGVAACSAETQESAQRILAAVRAAGLPGDADCAVGLGAPSPDWEEAVESGLRALTELGGGRFVLRDLAAEITAPEGTAPERLSAVTGTLDAALPDVFQVSAIMPPRMETTADGDRVYAPRFAASLADDGTVRLSGQVKDAASRLAIASYAAALFGHERVIDETVVDPNLPDGWPVRVLAGVEALSDLNRGTMTVTPETVAVSGSSIDANGADQVAARLLPKVGVGGAAIDVSFDAAAAEAAALAARPRPEICADQIAAVLDADSIVFSAGSAEIVPESRGVIAAIADVLRGCPGAEFEIAGHTDSQGDPAANQALSEARAEAVVDALRTEDLPLVHLHARGYGADRPIADNSTEAGRASNRRIEFVLAPPGGFVEEAPAPEPAETLAPLDAELATCAAEIADALSENSIQFDAGSAKIAPDSEAAVARIKEALGGCPDADFEVGGYTDSQGSDDGNLRLSEERARAVLTALRSDDLPLLAMTARGYGEADPIADNATAEGRAQNRRIEFTLPELRAAAAAEDADVALEAEGDGGPVEDGAAGESLAAAAQDGDPAEICLERLGAILAENSIDFAPGSAEITPESAPIVNALAGVLRGCPDAALEIGGHTDSVGSQSVNLALSQERAAAVLAAVRRPDLPLPGLTAQGYGESDPIADNGTAEGRAQNRRIAFEAGPAERGGEGDGSE
jgi:OOP family OmpA-OmpF porin